MAATGFQTATGQSVTAVTAAEMQAVDRVTVNEIGISLLQMMENAGRVLAWHVRKDADGPVTIVAGNGGNGGGGLVCARYLSNRGVPVKIVLDRTPDQLSGVTTHQYRIARHLKIPTVVADELAASGLDPGPEPAVVVDALIGYGLSGDVRSPAADLIERINSHSATTISLDVPSGINATTGAVSTIAVRPTQILTLALPKTGLLECSTPVSLVDIGIPTAVYDHLEIAYSNPFDTDWVALERV